MNRIISIILCLLMITVFSSFSYATEKTTEPLTKPPQKLPIDAPRVLLETSLGNMIIELKSIGCTKNR